MKLATENLPKNGKKLQIRKSGKRRSVLTDIRKSILLKEDVYQELHSLIRSYEKEIRSIENAPENKWKHEYRFHKLKQCLILAKALEPIARENRVINSTIQNAE